MINEGNYIDGNEFNSDALILPRPEEVIDAIIKALSPASQLITLEPRKKLHMNFCNDEQHCFLLLEGRFSFRRKINDVNVHTLHAPLVLGLSEMLSPTGFHFLFSETISKIGVVSYSDFIQCTNQHPHLWRSVAVYLAWINQRQIRRDIELSDKNVYSVVRSLLLRLDKEPNDYKSEVIASNYILDHTLLSKSSVMSILADLKKGGYIKTHKGRLVQLINLPKKY